jgi:hypothetical protein
MGQDDAGERCLPVQQHFLPEERPVLAECAAAAHASSSAMDSAVVTAEIKSLIRRCRIDGFSSLAYVKLPQTLLEKPDGPYVQKVLEQVKKPLKQRRLAEVGSRYMLSGKHASALASAHAIGSQRRPDSCGPALATRFQSSPKGQDHAIRLMSSQHHLAGRPRHADQASSAAAVRTAQLRAAKLRPTTTAGALLPLRALERHMSEQRASSAMDLRRPTFDEDMASPDDLADTGHSETLRGAKKAAWQSLPFATQPHPLDALNRNRELESLRIVKPPTPLNLFTNSSKFARLLGEAKKPTSAVGDKLRSAVRKSIQINQVMMLPKAGSVQSFASIVQKAVHDRRIEAFNRISSVTIQADKSSCVYPLLKRSAWNEYQSNKDVCAHDVTHGYETLQRICENVSLPASIIAEMSPEQLNAIEMQRKRQLQQMSYEAKQSDLAYLPLPSPAYRPLH